MSDNNPLVSGAPPAVPQVQLDIDLEAFGDLSADTRDANPVHMALCYRMRELVGSQHYKDLELIVGTVVKRYAVPINRRDHDQRAYLLFCETRDLMTELLTEICTLANTAQQGEHQ